MGKKPGIDAIMPWKLARVIRKESYDIVHTHNEAGLIYGTIAARLAGIRRIVHTEHGKEPGYHTDIMLQLVEKFLLKRVRCVVTVSDSLNEIMTSLMGKQNRVLTIKNGIDTGLYSRRRQPSILKQSLGIPSDCFLMGHVARLTPLKNQGFLLSIFGELSKQCNNLMLVIIGSGPLRAELEDECEKMGISGSVRFLGARTDIPELLSIFDLFLLTSHTEGISITILEAMAAGVPIVASRVGGNPEIIQDSYSGFLLPLNRPGEWVRKILELIENNNERSRISGNARETVMRTFSLEAMAAQYRSVYEKAASIHFGRPQILPGPASLAGCE